MTPNDVTFRVGSTSNRVGGQILQAASYVLHPEFDPVWLDFDVAVVTLDKPITDFTNISIVQLVDEKFTFENNDTVTVAGWGRTVRASAIERHKSVFFFSGTWRIS